MSEWKECKLGDVITLQRGHDLPKSKMMDGMIPVAGSNGIIGYHNEATTNAPGITIGRSGNLGNAYFYKVNFWAHNTTLYVKDFKGNDELFIYYFLKTFDFKQFNVGSAVPTLNRNHIHPLDVIIPPLPEQRAIASVLSSLDDKIDLLHRQNKTLEAMAETLFRQWFVEGADEGWEEGKIPDEFDFTMGLSPPGESYNEEGIGIPMYQGNADFEFRFPKRRVFTTDPKRFAEQFDTLISVRAPVGAQNMADERCCIGRGVATFRYKRNNDYYTYTYFKMKSLMKEIEQFNQTGTVFGSINKADFGDLTIVIPSVEFVDAFQKDIKPIDDKVIANCMQIRTLEKLRDTLLPKLMGGEVGVGYERL
jgi:type I restriction enzyme S subunit